MTEHEKRIRDALADLDDVIFDETVVWTTNVTATDLRALLADLDAVRGASKRLVDAVNYKAVCMAACADPEKIDFANECVWKAVDQTTRALKGATA